MLGTTDLCVERIPKSCYLPSLCVFSRFRCVRIFATPWIINCQVPLSMRFSRQEYWSGLLRPHPGDLPNTGTEPVSSALQVDSLLLSHCGKFRPVDNNAINWKCWGTPWTIHAGASLQQTFPPLFPNVVAGPVPDTIMTTRHTHTHKIIRKLKSKIHSEEYPEHP